MKRTSIVFGLSLLLMSGDALAEITKAECIDANTTAQSLRRKGRLNASRVELQKCINPICPPIVKSDCVQRLEELETAFPTVTFEVKNGKGEDLTAVTIKMDGTVLTTSLTGTPLRADPGPHEFTFETAGEKPVVRTFVLTEGEKGRREHVVIGEPPPPPPTTPTTPTGPVAPPPKQEGPPPRDGSGQRTLAIVGGVVGIAALGAGGIFGARAASQWSAAQRDCKSTEECVNRKKAADEHDSAVSAARLSTVFLIAGGVITVGAVVVYLVAPRGRAAAVLDHVRSGQVTF